MGFKASFKCGEEVELLSVSERLFQVFAEAQLTKICV